MAQDTRPCPFCAEEIKRAALVCKHCGRDVPKHAAPPKQKLSFWQFLAMIPAGFIILAISFGGSKDDKAKVSDDPSQLNEYCRIVEVRRAEYARIDRQISNEENGLKKEDLRSQLDRIFVARNEELHILLTKEEHHLHAWPLRLKTLTTNAAVFDFGCKSEITFRWDDKEPPPGSVLASLTSAEVGKVLKVSGIVETRNGGRFCEGSFTSSGAMELPELKLSHVWFRPDQYAEVEAAISAKAERQRQLAADNERKKQEAAAAQLEEATARKGSPVQEYCRIVGTIGLSSKWLVAAEVIKLLCPEMRSYMASSRSGDTISGTGLSSRKALMQAQSCLIWDASRK